MRARAVPALTLACFLGGLLVAPAPAQERRAGAAAPRPAPRSAPEPRPKTPIQHFVVLMQENHTFDNYFGTYPGANGLPKGACMPIAPRGGPRRSEAFRRYARPGGVGGTLSRVPPPRTARTRSGSTCVPPFHLGALSEDVPHTFAAHRVAYARGRMDGFIDASAKEGLGPDPGTMGYYDRRDLPFHWKVADQYVLFDRMFSSAAAGSFPNHMFWVTGTIGNPRGFDVPHNGFSDLPTIFDRLEKRGVSWKFYVEDYDPLDTYRTNRSSPQVHWVPLLTYNRYIKSKRLRRHIVDLDQYYEDLRRGTLPAVAYVAPFGESEHPPGSIRAGQRFVASQINALMQSRYWRSSAYMYAYDDWGGWYDHVRPPQVDKFGYGFRVPALLVSAYARRGYIDHTTLDFTSILKFIELNWGLRPLATRDARAKSIGGAFDFSKPPRSPRILSADLHPQRPAQPRREVIYGAYGAALGLMVLIVLFLLISAFFRRRRRGGPGPPGPLEPLIDPAAADTRELEPVSEPVDRAVARRPGGRVGPGHVGSRAALGLAALLFVVVLGAAYGPGRSRRAA